MRSRILIVEDDETVASLLARYLVRDGYDVESVGTGEFALERAESDPPDLIVLDLMLPGIGGLDVCTRLRSRTSVPIIMLTALGEERDRVFGLRLGADDYVVKPFSPRELSARVGSVLRRSTRVDGFERLVAGAITVDPAARTVSVDGRDVELTAREFDLLAFLLRHRDRVFRRDELLEHVWGYRVGETATVTVHIRRLRAKIERDPSRPRHLETVWGVGYRFRA